MSGHSTSSHSISSHPMSGVTVPPPIDLSLYLVTDSAQASTAGRSIVDVVMQTPDRLSEAVKVALETELPALRPAAVRSRFTFREKAKPAELVKVLEDIRHRKSMGVILKAPDVPEISEQVAEDAHDALSGIRMEPFQLELKGTGSFAKAPM